MTQVPTIADTACECDGNVTPGAIATPHYDGVAVERCDLCQRFAGDLEAARAFAASRIGRGGWIVTDWEADGTLASGQSIVVYDTLADACRDLHDRIGQADDAPDDRVAIEARVEFVPPNHQPERTYTVVGYYPDNRQPWATSVTAPDAVSAEEAGRAEMYDANDGDVSLDDIRTAAVIEGRHRIFGGDEGDDG